MSCHSRQGEQGDYINATGMPECNDPRLSASRSLFPGGAVTASLTDGGYPVVTAAAPLPLPVAPPIIGAPVVAPGTSTPTMANLKPCFFECQGQGDGGQCHEGRWRRSIS